MIPIEILVIDDSAADMKLLSLLFAKSSVPHRLHFASSGTEGSDFLAKRGKFASSPTPDLVLMDLNLPKKDGREILREVKADPRLCCIPIIMLTTSSNDEDVMDAYRLGASAFISKPLGIGQFQNTIDSLISFWFQHVQLPTRIGHDR